jgi:hypothetical protein
MLEILVIYFFGKKVGSIAEDKGYNRILFIVVFAGCWLMGDSIRPVPL